MNITLIDEVHKLAIVLLNRSLSHPSCKAARPIRGKSFPRSDAINIKIQLALDEMVSARLDHPRAHDHCVNIMYVNGLAFIMVCSSLKHNMLITNKAFGISDCNLWMPLCTRW